MHRATTLRFATVTLAAALGGCATSGSGGWTTLIDGTQSLDNFNRVGAANSGIFFRCQDPGKITDENCYEANIFDQRPDPSYGTGAIVKVAKLEAPMIKAGGQWNSFDISARGSRLTLVLNGVKTVEIDDAKLARGPIALQWGRGTIKFRKVEVKPL